MTTATLAELQHAYTVACEVERAAAARWGIGHPEQRAAFAASVAARNAYLKAAAG